MRNPGHDVVLVNDHEDAMGVGNSRSDDRNVSIIIYLALDIDCAVLSIPSNALGPRS